MELEFPRNNSGPNSKINFFLWVSHGTNVSANHNFYPMNVKYQSLMLYSKPYAAISNIELEPFINDACKLLSGSCPIIPILNNTTGEKIAYLPPLIFACNVPEQSPYIQSATGLYYLRIKKHNFSNTNSLIDVCSYEQTTKLLD